MSSEQKEGSNIETVGILGGMSSQSTIEYYRGIDEGINDSLGGHDAGDILIRSINFEELTRGETREDSRDQYLGIIDDLVEAGADGIVLGCTEIDLLIEQDDYPEIPLFDTTALHVERAVERSLTPVSDS